MNALSEQSQSLWMTTRMPRGKPLTSDIKTDVLVIGAGIAGLSIAYELRQAGHEVVLAERGRIGGGMTARTSAHLSWEIDDCYFRIIEGHGAAVARAYLASQQAALDRIAVIVDQERINCDFARVDLFFTPDNRKGRSDLKQELAALRSLGISDVSFAECPVLGAAGEALRFPNQARFHAQRYLAGLARAISRMGGAICDHTPIVKLTESARQVRAVAENGATITAKAAVMATATPFTNRVAIHDRQTPYRSYVFAAPVAKGSVPDILFWDTHEAYHYVRLQPGEDKDYLIVGGEDHKTGEADDGLAHRDRLYTWAKERFPSLGAIEYFWSGQIFEPVDYLPFIGPDPNHKRIYFVSGDSGEGLTTAVAASLILPNLIAGKKHPWARAYRPNRKLLKLRKPSIAVTYAKDFAGAMKHVVERFLPDTKTAGSLRAGEGAVVSEKDEKVAAYRDEKGRLHRCLASCTHAGCVVQWNGFERCWDCPCHGSQFLPDGTVLNGPATIPLKPAPEAKAAPARAKASAG